MLSISSSDFFIFHIRLLFRIQQELNNTNQAIHMSQPTNSQTNAPVVSSSLLSSPYNIVPSNQNSTGVSTLTNNHITNGNQTAVQSKGLIRNPNELHNPTTINNNETKENAFITSGKETNNSNNSNPIPLTIASEILPFDNYRFLPQSNMGSHRNNSYAGADRLSDDERYQDGDGDDEDENHEGLKRLSHIGGAISSIQTSRQNEIFNNVVSSTHQKSITGSTVVDPKTKISKEHSKLGENYRAMQELRSMSSSSSSSMPVDDGKTRRFHFVPVPFNGKRLVAKSTEQLNSSSSTMVASFQMPTNVDSPASMLKQKFLLLSTSNSRFAWQRMNCMSFS